MKNDLSYLKLKLDDIELSLIHRAEDITDTSYRDYVYEITLENLFTIIDDLTDKVYELQEKLEELKQDMTENYELTKEAKECNMADR